MASLDRTLRKDLETTVKKARRVAEAGARMAVAQLGVGETEAPKHLSAEQRTLRNRLRAHGRQLGDRRDTRTGIQDTGHLVQECAYEHWHRMLFARFLAETDLLIEPASGVAITLDEVQELAREKATDWLELASDYAERMLPQIFRKDDPVLQIALPPETRSEMENLLKKLPKAAFEADDSLGWVYQFWQSDKKEEVNKSEVKIGADELPAVTQLFTEDYMVLFLLHNTLGAWWAGKVLAKNPTLATTAASEEALRAACKVGDVEWTYLRFVRDNAEAGWRPAGGAFEGWPNAAKDITVLDPCMGSGHFLVFALPILIAFRMSEEGLSQQAAVDAVLKDNLFGLEIDPRCTQIAAFNLAFAAWRKVGHRSLPRLNLACSGLAIGVTKSEWLRLAEKAVTAADPAAKRDLLGVEKNLLTVGLEERVKNGLEALYDLFAKAPWLGSLIDPRRAGADIFREGFDKLEPLLASILAAADTDDAREMAVAAQGMAKAAELLTRAFTLVATNVPYLSRSKQSDQIKDWTDRYYSNAKGDLATVFVARATDLTGGRGTVALVTPDNWFFLPAYKSFRNGYVRKFGVPLCCLLGPAAFRDMNWWAARTALTIVSTSAADTCEHFGILDASENRDFETKERICSGRQSPSIYYLKLSEALTAEDHRLSIKGSTSGAKIGDIAKASQGLKTGDDDRFTRQFWEINEITDGWKRFQSTTNENLIYGGMQRIVRWHDDGKDLARRQGLSAWGKIGIAVSQMRHLPASMYLGDAYDSNICVIVPDDPTDTAALLAFAHSGLLTAKIREIEPGAKVNNGTFAMVPFDLSEWRNRADVLFADGLPKPASKHAIEWTFSGDPSRADTPLLVAVARLSGFNWPRGTDRDQEANSLDSDTLASHLDEDGIVCLSALKGEPPAEQRLNALLADAFGADWSAAKLASLLADAGYAGKSLDDWLRDGFFAQHCELFHQRPFVWHIWDGRRDGFHALVNYHRLAAPKGEGRRTLEKLIYSYLGDWIDRQRADQKAGVEGADARLAHAEHLKAELIKILEGEPPYDIFVRWKPLHEQPVGWDPDIDDGVRVNIRPFMTARTLNARSANTCILRSTPKIKWDKDRGKEPTRDKDDYPWFWGWDQSSADFPGGAEFDGNRWNDLHYSRAAKQSARDRHRASVGGKA
jgi:hypothetical protein